MTQEIAIILAANSHNNKCHAPGLGKIINKKESVINIYLLFCWILILCVLEYSQYIPDEGSHSSINLRDVKLIYNQMLVVISGLMIPAPAIGA